MPNLLAYGIGWDGSGTDGHSAIATEMQPPHRISYFPEEKRSSDGMTLPLQQSTSSTVRSLAAPAILGKRMPS